MEHKSPKVTVDAVIIEDYEVFLIRRKFEPFKDTWAFPGGYVEYGETVESAVVREALEETNLEVRITGLIGVYSSPDRDPRGHTVGIAFLCEKIGGSQKAADDAKEVKKFRLDKLPKLAFDHQEILNDAKELLNRACDF